MLILKAEQNAITELDVGYSDAAHYSQSSPLAQSLDPVDETGMKYHVYFIADDFVI